jgi:LAO/AO transport system kinase
LTRRELAKAITLIESTRAEDQDAAQEVLIKAMSHSGKAWRIAISGVPGVGKSTFIESLGWMLAESGRKVAVLAVDPSSPVSGGSILGDKTRMEKLSAHPHAFIRPSPTAGSLGGVSRKTREAILLCEAAGYDVVLIETVGVGQSEVEVASLSDLFVLLMLPGAGDSLQGIKRGILELADLVVVNKSDGDNIHRAEAAQAELQAVLGIEVQRCSALEADGLRELWSIMESRLTAAQSDGSLEQRRRTQTRAWLKRTIDDRILSEFWSASDHAARFEQSLRRLETGEITPFEAIRTTLG